MKEIYSISSYWSDRPSELARPFRFFENREEAEKETKRLNEKKLPEGYFNFRYMMETFHLE